VIHPRTRLSFWLAFGLTPDYQVAIEDHYSQVVLDTKESAESRLPFHNVQLWG